MMQMRRGLHIGLSRAVPLVALLGVCLLAVAALAWQAIDAARSQAATAERLLLEYATRAAEEFARRATVEIGYYGVYLLANELVRRANSGQAPLSIEAIARADDGAVRRAATLARTIQRASPTDAAIQQLPTPAEAGDEPFLIRHLDAGGESRSMVYVPLRDGWLQIELDRTALAEWFRMALTHGPLLPALGDRGEAALAVAVSTPDGAELFVHGAGVDGSLRVSRPFGAEYGGLLSGFQLEIALSRDIDGSPVAGGMLAGTRIPLTVALLAVATALLIIAMLQVRRERALAKMRADFVARVSHELRTPLAQIRMFAETLLYERVRGHADRRQFIDVIVRETQRLGHLVDNILRFSHRSPVQPAAQLLSLASQVRAVVDEFTPLAEAAGSRIDCRLDATATVVLSAEALRQILLNLLDNAIKYAAPGSILIDVTVEDGTCRLVVEDDGPGVPPVERERIFDAFYRPRVATSGATGTGIGLTVVRDLVTGSAGRCSVASGAAGGARFVIEWPAADRGAA